MDEENQYPEDLPGEEDYATGYEQASEPLPEEAYDDLPFEPVGGPIRETAMGRYMREHRLLNSMLMALLIMLVFFWAFWDLVLYGLTQGADGSDFSEAAVSRARKNPPKTNTNLVKRQKKPQPSAQPTTKAIAISDISMPNLSELNIATLAPVVETPGLSMGEMGSSDDAKKALQNLGLALPTPMKSRCDPQARINRLKQGGGKASTEEVIKKGLDWLKATQDKDGSWGANDKGPDGNKKSTDRNAMTGMALLCFLGHCELQDSADYGNTVHRAIEFLSSTPGNAFTGKECYSHPIRTYALCEAFTMTKIKKLESIAQIAAEAVIKGQNESGGWAYGYKTGPTGHTDLSVTGWNIQALKAAALTGLYIDGLDEAMDKAIDYVKRCQDGQGMFAYKELPPNSARGGKPSLTGTGVLSLQIWKNAKSEEATRGLEWIVNNLDTEWASVDVYEWYYHAQACFQATSFSSGKKYWKAWNKDFEKIVHAAQASDGHWPQDGGHHNSEIYRTTMTILMLEVYYRFAPMGGGKH